MSVPALCGCFAPKSLTVACSDLRGKGREQGSAVAQLVLCLGAPGYSVPCTGSQPGRTRPELLQASAQVHSAQRSQLKRTASFLALLLNLGSVVQDKMSQNI